MLLLPVLANSARARRNRRPSRENHPHGPGGASTTSISEDETKERLQEDGRRRRVEWARGDRHACSSAPIYACVLDCSLVESKRKLTPHHRPRLYHLLTCRFRATQYSPTHLSFRKGGVAASSESSGQVATSALHDCLLYLYDPSSDGYVESTGLRVPSFLCVCVCVCRDRERARPICTV